MLHHTGGRKMRQHVIIVSADSLHSLKRFGSLQWCKLSRSIICPGIEIISHILQLRSCKYLHARLTTCRPLAFTEVRNWQYFMFLCTPNPSSSFCNETSESVMLYRCYIKKEVHQGPHIVHCSFKNSREKFVIPGKWRWRISLCQLYWTCACQTASCMQLDGHQDFDFEYYLGQYINETWMQSLLNFCKATKLSCMCLLSLDWETQVGKLQMLSSPCISCSHSPYMSLAV